MLHYDIVSIALVKTVLGSNYQMQTGVMEWSFGSLLINNYSMLHVERIIQNILSYNRGFTYQIWITAMKPRMQIFTPFDNRFCVG